MKMDVVAKRLSRFQVAETKADAKSAGSLVFVAKEAYIDAEGGGRAWAIRLESWAMMEFGRRIEDTEHGQGCAEEAKAYTIEDSSEYMGDISGIW